MSPKKATVALLALTAVLVIVGCLLPRIPQPLSYHNFADHRSWMGIANFGDVLSNLAFAIFGVWGLWFLLRLNRAATAMHFADPRERWFYLAIFFGLVLTAAGSSYYHLAPDSTRLVWDRLPMTIVFMSLVAAMIAERISVRAALWLWAPLLAMGILSVLEWRWSEMRGAGDLRFYAVVQAYAALVLLVMMFFSTRYTSGPELAVVIALYVLAKLLETFDRPVFALGHLISGHTLKHIAAAFAGFWILRMLKRRTVLATTYRSSPST